MRYLQLLFPLVASGLMSGCATQPQPRERQSIVEVVDSAKQAAAAQSCMAGQINYCVDSPGGVKRCTCLDSREMSQALGGLVLR